MNLKGKLREKLEQSGPTKLSVFDFDGTLIDTPLPQIGKPIWKEKTGNEWPHQGWWSKVESLDMDMFDMPTLPSVIADYQKEKAVNNTMVIMLTGRRDKAPLKDAVKKILDAKGLKFDMYLYNYGGETSANKRQQIERILTQYPTIKSVEMWDDRDEHIPTFQSWGDNLVKSGVIEEFKINHVIGEHHGLTP